MQRTVVEMAAPVAAVAGGTALGVFTDQTLYFTLMPALGGAMFSTYLRIHKGKRKIRDVLFAVASAVVIGVIFGPWVADMAPKSESALAPMCFVMAMLGTRSAEKLADFDWDITVFLRSILKGSNDKDKE